MSKHTPGPWNAEGRGTGLVIVFVGDARPDFERPAVCALMDGPENERQANARLIAAAPDLLDACNRVDFWLDTVPKSSAIREVVRAAISKATGGP